ncbi:Hypothetical protein GLP15_4842 [Giardia lamblia P15]|uniref:Uncharacterized protein n=1 Tax=Giardia intestinalis (strain P15) TaxID=658858 RepID=E1EYC8_GIAIA|nr:Hypothetical protein GLP15_4842 [Giardia lamblia P15]
MEKLYTYIEQAHAALEAGVVRPNTLLDSLSPEHSHLKQDILLLFPSQIEKTKGLSESLLRFHTPCLTVQENLEVAYVVRNGLEMKAARLPSPIHPLFRLSVPQENLITIAKRGWKKS